MAKLVKAIMKTTLIVTAAGLLHIAPIAGIATMAITSNPIATAIAAGFTAITCLGVGYLHGYQKWKSIGDPKPSHDSKPNHP